MPGRRKRYVLRVETGKRDATRRKHLAEAIVHLEKSEEPGMQ